MPDTNLDTNKDKRNTVFIIEIFVEFFAYAKFRARQIYIWSILIIEFTILIISNIKREIVKRMFWGRNSFYRKAFHLTILFITFLLLVNGVSERVQENPTTSKTGLNVASQTIGQQDILLQYSNSRGIILKENDAEEFFTTHRVQKGETLKEIGESYGFDDANAIIWANKLDPYNPKLFPDQILKIPLMKGVLRIAPKGGASVKTLAAGVVGPDGAAPDLVTVLELHDIKTVDEILPEGTIIFIPNGYVPLPKPGSNVSGSTAIRVNLTPTKVNIPAGTFTNPAGDPTCGGYTISRGWASYHTGVDLAKRDGCWIRSVGEGTVVTARMCGKDLGFCVVIKHTNGYSTLYAHGNGTFAVDEGDKVSAGQQIMYMGCTGKCTGTHLHFSLAPDGIDIVNQYNSRIDPKGIVPY